MGRLYLLYSIVARPPQPVGKKHRRLLVACRRLPTATPAAPACSVAHQGAQRSVRDGSDPGRQHRRVPGWVLCAAALRMRSAAPAARCPLPAAGRRAADAAAAAARRPLPWRLTMHRAPVGGPFKCNCPAVEVGEKLVICLASTLNLDGTPSAASFDAVRWRAESASTAAAWQEGWTTGRLLRGRHARPASGSCAPCPRARRWMAPHSAPLLLLRLAPPLPRRRTSCLASARSWTRSTT